MEFIKNLIQVVDVVGVDKDTIIRAMNYSLSDFEDAIQVSASQTNEIEVLLTRNTVDFINAPLKAANPKEFLATLNV